MAHVVIDKSGVVVGVFAVAQPAIDGYVEIDDSDRRLTDFFARQNSDAVRQQILMQLNEIDLKSIRALREGDTARVASWESQAADLRLKLSALV